MIWSDSPVGFYFLTNFTLWNILINFTFNIKELNIKGAKPKEPFSDSEDVPSLRGVIRSLKKITAFRTNSFSKSVRNVEFFREILQPLRKSIVAPRDKKNK